jgi:formiminotetrahydrofolate cyclodeaminase
MLRLDAGSPAGRALRRRGPRRITIAVVPGPRDQRLASFLDEVAEATPAPGGGSSAAVALALGAALVEMSARLAGDADVASRAGGLRAQALELAERDLTSFAPVLEVARLPRDDTARDARLQQALLEASRTPLAIAQGAAEAAELGTAVARASSPHVRGDAVTGTLLAEASAAAGATLVEINLGRQPAAPELEQAREARARASRARADVEAGLS